MLQADCDVPVAKLPAGWKVGTYAFNQTKEYMGASGVSSNMVGQHFYINSVTGASFAKARSPHASLCPFPFLAAHLGQVGAVEVCAALRFSRQHTCAQIPTLPAVQVMGETALSTAVNLPPAAAAAAAAGSFDAHISVLMMAQAWARSRSPSSPRSRSRRSPPCRAATRRACCPRVLTSTPPTRRRVSVPV